MGKREYVSIGFALAAIGVSVALHFGVIEAWHVAALLGFACWTCPIWWER